MQFSIKTLLIVTFAVGVVCVAATLSIPLREMILRYVTVLLAPLLASLVLYSRNRWRAYAIGAGSAYAAMLLLEFPYRHGFFSSFILVFLSGWIAVATRHFCRERREERGESPES